MSKFKPYNSNKKIGKTHIGRLLRFPKEGGYEKRNNFLDDDIIHYDMLCGINGNHYEEDLMSIKEINEDNICFRCLKKYKSLKRLII